MSRNHRTFLAILLAAALEGGKILKENFRSEKVEAKTKSGHADLVTNADLETQLADVTSTKEMERRALESQPPEAMRDRLAGEVDAQGQLVERLVRGSRPQEVEKARAA